jgi:hypothetical protein
MNNIKLEHSTLSDEVVHNIANRDAVLWVGSGFDSTSAQVDLLRQLIELPWRLVLCESSNKILVTALESQPHFNNRFTQRRGFIHIVAADPEKLELPRRSLPVFMLNGRADAGERETSHNLRGNAALRRRLNMIKELIMARPTRLVVLSNGDDHPLEDIFELWDDEDFRALLTVISTTLQDKERIDNWLQTSSGRIIDFYSISLEVLVTDLLKRLLIEIPEEQLVIRLRYTVQHKLDLDITDCELIEQPLLDRYELLQSFHLHPLLPDDLSEDNFSAFFDKSKPSTWAPFAAGLPWNRGGYAKSELMKALKNVEKYGSDKNKILYIASEAGAGGTTLARMLAFEAAREGYPTLIARSVFFSPESTEITTFLYKVRQKVLTTPLLDDEKYEPPAETPWLLVFDVQHWEGREAELRSFLGELSRSGRSVVILLITGPDISDELQNSGRAKQIEMLNHELSKDEALSLGQHLNRFLKHHGKEKSDNEWLTFWNNHKPDISSNIASFWIALEFWLKGQLDINESIQSWLYRHFKEAELSNDLRMLLLEIAVMSLERRPLPEGLMPLSVSDEKPYTVLLEELRTQVPALALIRESATLQRQWAMAHDLLGRYLINSTYFDRLMLEKLGLSQAQDPVHLRLMLLRRIATRNDFAQPFYLTLAVDFAMNILKLEPDGNPEFFRYWREVLDILEHMPAALRETNRTFNHHVAISRRRTATCEEFDASLEEKKRQLELAIHNNLEFAIHYLERKQGDESDLNLFNSLSLAYQNLADIERELGTSEDQIKELRQKANEAALRALKENPTNSYVLETAARNLIQQGKLYKNEAVENASQALGYIFQAVLLERSEFRQNQLTRLANHALQLLRKTGTTQEIERICALGNPFGYLAKAWLALTNGIEEFETYQLTDLPRDNLNSALEILNQSVQMSHWLLLRFSYDLTTAIEAQAFDKQLNILDELAGTGYRMPLQLQLEYAILLYQRNRPHEANLKFQQIRQDLKVYDVIITVPKHLRWLLSEDYKSKRVCNASVFNDAGYRSWAKVRELKNVSAPFIPQDFGGRRMPPGNPFKCAINFNYNGPFIKPPMIEKMDSRERRNW